jgi:hypothetical protein
VSTTALRTELGRLTAERLEAVEAGLGANAAYMAGLEADIATTREAYIGAAVTEIATLRGQLTGALNG